MSTVLSKNKKSIVISKPGLNVSLPTEAAISKNKKDFVKAYKPVLHGYVENVYDELQQIKANEKDDAKDAKSKKADEGKNDDSDK